MSKPTRHIHSINDNSLKQDTIEKLIIANNRSGQGEKSMRTPQLNKSTEPPKSIFAEKYKLLLADPDASSKDISDLMTKIKSNISQIDDEISKLTEIKIHNVKMLDSLSRCIADDSIAFISTKTREFPDYYNVLRTPIVDDDESDTVEIKLKDIPNSQIKTNSDGTRTILLESVRQKIIKECLKVSFDPKIKSDDSTQCFICTVIGAIRR